MKRTNTGSRLRGQNKLKKNGILYARKVRLRVKDICDKCPASKADGICSGYVETIDGLDELYNKIDKITSLTDPIEIEYALAKHEKFYQDTKSFVDGIDTFIKNCEECDRRPVK